CLCFCIHISYNTMFYSLSLHDALPISGLEDYIKHYEPVLIGAGAGTDCLLANGYTPHVVVGGIDELSDRSLRCGGEIIITTSSGDRKSTRLNSSHVSISYSVFFLIIKN